MKKKELLKEVDKLIGQAEGYCNLFGDGAIMCYTKANVLLSRYLVENLTKHNSSSKKDCYCIYNCHCKDGFSICKTELLEMIDILDMKDKEVKTE
jgi:hypothetical protein